MKPHSRRIRIAQIPSLAWEALTMIPPSLQFRAPVSLWYSYIRQESPNGNSVRFRDGSEAWMSDNPHDIVTLMVNFCKKDYGTIQPNSLVVDIGANIGMFSLYACRSGASRLLAFEPNGDSFQTLSKNISQKSIETDVSIYKMAVTGIAGERVYIPNKSSPYNAISESPEISTEQASVETIDLDGIVELCNGRRIDYLKIDCEGAEWEILSKCSQKALSQIDRIRMEFHPRRGRSKSEIVDRLLTSGFKLTNSKHLIVWLER